MKKTVFYSWQSDLPNSDNRGFIQTALEKAATSIASDNAINIDPVIDRDTKDIAGSPDIAATIFSKISSADIFVADISIIHKKNGCRPTPNPNILIELGYALKTMGYERIVLVFNEAYGEIQDLPFDLRSRRLTIYNSSKDKKELKNKLENAIIAALKNIPVDIDNSVVKAIEEKKNNRIIILRKEMDSIFKDIISLKPKKFSEGGTAEELITALRKNSNIIVKFSKIVEVAAIMDDRECISEIYQWFGKIFENYDLPYGFSGAYSNADFDYFRFIGHELIVILFSFLLKEKKWKIIKELFGELIPIKYLHSSGGLGYASSFFASAPVYSLYDESIKRNRYSMQADELVDRHDGELLNSLTFDEFASADFFLFVASKILPSNEKIKSWWFPYSVARMKNVPRFLKNAISISVAKQIAEVLGLSSADELKKRLKELYPEFNNLVRVGFWQSPVNEVDIDNIASI